VRIEASQLAQAGEDDEERPPSPPTGLRVPGQGSSSAGATPFGGVSHPSSVGGAQGGAGVSMPSAGQASANRSQKAPSPKRPKHAAPVDPRSVNVPLDLTVACGPEGVVLHPGGYRLTLATLKRDKGLRRDLETIVANYAIIDPLIHPRPRITFLVEPGGGESYAEARRQTVLSDLTWPVTIQVAGNPSSGLFPKERF
jgi:hypothetical protein